MKPEGFSKTYELTLKDVNRYLHWPGNPGWPGLKGRCIVSVSLTGEVINAEVRDADGSVVRFPPLRVGDL